MMKTSKIVLGICGIAAGVALVSAGVWFVSYAGSRTMDREEALRYALEDAELVESDVTITREKLERDDGMRYYEIEFYSAEYAYEYEIDAVNGDVLGVSIEALFEGPLGAMPPASGAQPSDGNLSAPGAQPSDGNPPASVAPSSPEPQPAPGTPAVGDDRIGLDAAKEVALQDAGFAAADVVFTKAEFDYDDGMELYEIEFYVGRTEYEYEIDAVTGAVVSRDTDYDSYDDYGGYRGHHSSHRSHNDNCWYE